MIFLGGISYTLYLLHQNIGYAVIREATACGVHTDMAIALAVVVSVALASALTYMVERPARIWIRNRFRNMHVTRNKFAAVQASPP